MVRKAAPFVNVRRCTTNLPLSRAGSDRLFSENLLLPKYEARQIGLQFPSNDNCRPTPDLIAIMNEKGNITARVLELAIHDAGDR